MRKVLRVTFSYPVRCLSDNFSGRMRSQSQPVLIRLKKFRGGCRAPISWRLKNIFPSRLANPYEYIIQIKISEAHHGTALRSPCGPVGERPSVLKGSCDPIEITRVILSYPCFQHHSELIICLAPPGNACSQESARIGSLAVRRFQAN
jgi:hypothetical protein